MLTVRNCTLAIAAVAASLVTLGCQQSKQLSEMHDSTSDMNRNTKQMGQTTARMLDVTNDMGQRTGEMNGTLKLMKSKTDQLLDQTVGLKQGTTGFCLGSRHALTLQARGQNLAALTKEAIQPIDKIAQGGEYMMGFEYQFWGICGPSDDDNRDILMQLSAQEFMRSVQRFVNVGKPVAPLNLASTSDLFFGAKSDTNNMDANFNTIAVTLHIIDPLQKVIIARENARREQLAQPELPANLQPVSMYSMIKEALTEEKDVDSGKISEDQEPGYVKEILQQRQIAMRVLQARHNFLAAMFLGEVRDKTDLGGAVAIGIDIAIKLNIKWPFKLDGLHVEELRELNEFLEGAIGTRTFLKSIGEKIYTDPGVAVLIKNARPVTADDKNPNALKTTLSIERAKLKSQLETLQSLM